MALIYIRRLKMKYCPSCYAQVEDRVMTCPDCGASFEGVEVIRSGSNFDSGVPRIVPQSESKTERTTGGSGILSKIIIVAIILIAINTIYRLTIPNNEACTAGAEVAKEFGIAMIKFDMNRVKELIAFKGNDAFFEEADIESQPPEIQGAISMATVECEVLYSTALNYFDSRKEINDVGRRNLLEGKYSNASKHRIKVRMTIGNHTIKTEKEIIVALYDGEYKVINLGN